MADDRKPIANITPFGLRMQPDLKARVELSARENNRSLNAEIVYRLEESLARDVWLNGLSQLEPTDTTEKLTSSLAIQFTPPDGVAERDFAIWLQDILQQSNEIVLKAIINEVKNNGGDFKKLR